jgi:hypothetical protein
MAADLSPSATGAMTTLFREYSPAALGEILARAGVLQQLPHAGNLARQLVQFGDLSLPQRLPALGGRGSIAKSIKELPCFGQAEAACFGACQHSQPLHNYPVVPPSAADGEGLRQHAGLLVKADAEAAKPDSFATCPIVIPISLLDLKLTLRWLILA